MNKLQILRKEFIKWWSIRNECKNPETIKNITECKIDPLADRIIDQWRKDQADDLQSRFDSDAAEPKRVAEKIFRRTKNSKRSNSGPKTTSIGKFRI